MTAALVIAGVAACKNPVQNNEPQEKKDRQWEVIGPGGGGATFIPTFSSSNSNKFLVRCDMTGSYLTQDGGQTYRQINFPNGATSFAYDPKDPNIVYAGSSVLSRSTDGGKTWSQVFPDKREVVKTYYTGDHANFYVETKAGSLYESGNINNIRIDPVKEGTIYFTVANWFFFSRDNGITWTKKDCNTPVDFIYTNSSSAKNDVYIFTPAAIIVFEKTGGTFSEQPLPAAVRNAFSFTAGTRKNTDSIVFYTIHHDPLLEINAEFGYSEIWMSEDLGSTWIQVTDTVITNSGSGVKPSFSMIKCAEQDAGNAYVVTNRYLQQTDTAQLYWYGAIKTSDGGKRWQWCWKGGGGSGRYAVKDGQDAANLSDAWVQKAFGGEYIRLMDVGVYPADGNIAIVTDWYRTMKTTDGGKTWEQVYSVQHGEGFVSRGIDVTTAYGVHFDPFDSSHIAISYTDIGYHHSYDGGKTWIRSADGVPAAWVNTCYWVVFDPAVKNRVWSAWSGMHDYPRGKMTRNPQWKQNAKGGVCVSDDGGKTWTPVYEGMGFDSPTTCMVLDTTSPAGSRTLYAAVYNKGVFKSTNGGKSWALKNKGLEANTCAFELTLTHTGDLYLVVSATPQHKDGKRGRSFYSGAVYKSADNAESWQKLTVSNELLFPNGIAFDPDNANRIYLGCWADIDLSDLIGGDVARSTGGNEKLLMPGGVLLSEDGGTTWKNIFDEKQYVYDVAVDPRHKGRLYINTFNSAAYRSDDYGKTWKKLKGYDFHWGQRPVIDVHDPEKIYLTTFGSSVLHGKPETE
ncbi:MAG TPA: hypothetical protein PL085_17670 [Agriterribacter sp.]|uniref:WD40/YVTN/BNR-like repeat-containing protein n=1 Tax=Agriterribacter sp. TaxID=2821509 RepID=UPI002CD2E41D|nr:hypothetical protein [Agriterribacter sp.]HRQ18908.1 hypothetical protein [Agriterribacter sp.]